VPALQLPAPSQNEAVIWSVAVLHEVPQLVVLGGYWQAPVPDAHAIAPQVPPVTHAVPQQKPVPFTPQWPLAQLASLVQAWPAASLQVPPWQS
jgi:hypothetical protein